MENVINIESKAVASADLRNVELPECCLTCKNGVDREDASGIQCSTLRQTTRPFNVCNHFDY